MTIFINFITILAVMIGIFNIYVVVIRAKSVMSDPEMLINQKLGKIPPGFLIRPAFYTATCVAWLIARFFLN